MTILRRLRRIRFRNTYANIASTVSLFLVLTTGTAYAASTITGADVVDGTLTGVDVSDNSIGVADVGTDAVGYNELQYNSVTGSHVLDNSIGGADITNGSVQTADAAPSFKAPDAEKVDGMDSTAFQRSVEWAHVYYGHLLGGRGAVQVTSSGPGIYMVKFRDTTKGCALVATPESNRDVAAHHTSDPTVVSVTLTVLGSDFNPKPASGGVHLAVLC